MANGKITFAALKDAKKAFCMMYSGYTTFPRFLDKFFNGGILKKENF